MAMYPGPGTPRPDQNQQISEARHEQEREHARQAAMANEARPSWWKRFKSTFSRHSPDAG
jgi:hypothetical protein